RRLVRRVTACLRKAARHAVEARGHGIRADPATRNSRRWMPWLRLTSGTEPAAPGARDGCLARARPTATQSRESPHVPTHLRPGAARCQRGAEHHRLELPGAFLL